MGSGRFNTSSYAAAASVRSLTGASAFAYTDTTLKGTPRSQWKVHPDLEPKGVVTRESRDSTEHPTSLAIAVLFDTTGSMHRVPRVLQTALPHLFDSIQQNNYVEHPQIMFGAIGDAHFDPISIQISQFESDNRVEDHLGNILLYGGGGNGLNESYELGLYFMARHTSIDCHEKRGQKGYLFIIGDEQPYPNVNHQELLDVFDQPTQETLSFEDVLKEAQEKYEVYFLLPGGSVNENNPKVINFWTQHLGDHFLRLPDPADVVEAIGMTIATNEAVKNLAAVTAPTIP